MFIELIQADPILPVILGQLIRGILVKSQRFQGAGGIPDHIVLSCIRNIRSRINGYLFGNLVIREFNAAFSRLITHKLLGSQSLVQVFHKFFWRLCIVYLLDLVLAIRAFYRIPIFIFYYVTGRKSKGDRFIKALVLCIIGTESKFHSLQIGT